MNKRSSTSFRTCALLPVLAISILPACAAEDPDSPTDDNPSSAGTGGTTGAGGSGGDGPVPGAPPCTAGPRSFWTWDLGVMPPADVQVPATCVAQTESAYIYVADEVWGTQMSQEQIDRIAHAFEQATPAAPERGIWETVTELFGEPPDVDGDPRVVLLYLPMADYEGYAFDGFFRGVDETNNAVSNKVEMVHLNAVAGNAPDSDYMLGVLAHELVHLIGSRYDESEEGWLSESLAEAAMVRAGYLTDLPIAKGYVKSTANTPLCVSEYSDYGATFAWGTYALDRFGASFMRGLLQDPSHGQASLDAHLPSDTDFKQVFGEFMVACLLDAPDIDDGRWGFTSIDASSLGAETDGVLDGVAHEVTTVAFGARMLRFTPPSAGTLSLDLTSGDSDELVVHSVALDPANPASARIEHHAMLQSSVKLDLSVEAGEVLDLVIASAPGASLTGADGTPTAKLSYAASFTP